MNRRFLSLFAAMVLWLVGCVAPEEKTVRVGDVVKPAPRAAQEPKGPYPVQPKMPAAPAVQVAAQPTMRPTVTGSTDALQKELDAERSAHARTRGDLSAMTRRCSDLEREAERLKTVRETRPVETIAPSAKTAALSDATEQKLLTLGRDFYDAGNFDSARKVLDVLVGLGHKGGYTYFMLGRCYAEMGQSEKAASYYKMTCDFYEPVNPKPKYYLYALNNLGALLREQKRYGEARVVYERAEAADPTYASAHYNLGILYADYLGDKKLALEHFQKYLDLKGERSAEVQDRIRKVLAESKTPAKN